MKKPIAFIVLLIVCTTIIAQKKPKIQGNKEVIQIVQNIPESFNALEIDDGLEVTLTPGVQNGYIMDVDRNLAEVVQFCDRCYCWDTGFCKTKIN
jgi:hypothetical protein